MAYGDFKDLARRTASDKLLRDKVFNFAKNYKYDGFEWACFYGLQIFWKKVTRNGINIPLESNEKLAEELHKPIIRNFLKSLFRIGRRYLGSWFSWYPINKQF